MIKYIVSLSVLVLLFVIAMVMMAANSRHRRVPHQTDRLPELSSLGSSKPFVHSRAKNLSNYIAPFEYSDSETILRFAAKRNWQVLRQSDVFIHFEAKTAFFGFADDVYFEFDALSKQIYVCSKSRIGKSDMGANRRRMESLRKEILAINPKELTDHH